MTKKDNLRNLHAGCSIHHTSLWTNENITLINKCECITDVPLTTGLMNTWFVFPSRFKDSTFSTPHKNDMDVHRMEHHTRNDVIHSRPGLMNARSSEGIHNDGAIA